ncbi:J domain-containing protein [Spiroplasma taiwanense]|uniref:J domain-containing protein n=1 Tax=Spiroplasma taiwanense CT-1 TaxID=1276220 RepID=S5MCU6_9MOLU|nr:J domain-containing protein [Spiroplasma taiwanense]AGR41548.1 hypothetical protein STAIW_v1c09620 [Spiroplasma taiwanense CT-1]
MDELVRVILRILYYMFIFWIIELIFSGFRNRSSYNNRGQRTFDEGFEQEEGFSSRYDESSRSAPSQLEEAFKVLNLPTNASTKDIKKRYIELAKKYHPDKNPNDLEAQAQMTMINNAYDLIMEHRK